MEYRWAACWLEPTVTTPCCSPQRWTAWMVWDRCPTASPCTWIAGYDSDKTRALLDERGLYGRIAHKGEKAPIQASQRWHVERTHAWQNAFHRLARCYERRAAVINAFFDLAPDTVITVRSLIRRAWTTHRWGERPSRRP